ncbi:hypothetical protein D8674_003584 [Pyrus ussuriensis x Pyrus communis]|uniref:NmrA-like domain-containing protein n=1 Tax=Pyrus ussuriensis x Pyrus communis TaxID=2448454 RepID=A0A5N5FHI0_9ROSA|nr:hypothetical protein D8674_003584 [Pyrus ussuriensis x Pyrus communis]
MAMAWRLPTLLATPGNLHHRDSDTPSFQASLSWCRTLAPDHLLPSSSSSTSTATHSSPPFNRKAFHFSTVIHKSQKNPYFWTNTWRFMKCTARVGAGAVNLARGTPVRPSSTLVVGATETLGRQIVRRAVDEGYVSCLVRPRPTPAYFLRDWRATVAMGLDWEGKVALIQCAKAMGIQKFVFYSIHNCDKHPEVPLMEIKYCTENIAVPILEEKSVWGTDAPTRIAYMDTQFNHALTDVDPLTFIGLRNEKVSGNLLTFAGPCAWTTQEVCEARGKYYKSPRSVLRVTRQLTRLFECTNDVADRVAFSEFQ